MWNYAAGFPHPFPHFEGHGLSGELSDLVESLQKNDQDLAKLRGLLASLRRHREAVIAA